MNIDLTPVEDYKHVLAPNEHEAVYFVFSQPDGAAFGYVRNLFGYDNVLEMVALRVGERTWVHQQRFPYAPISQPTQDASSPNLALKCQSPWQTWTMQFQSKLTSANTKIQCSLNLEFSAGNAPARYRFGASYQQAQQDGPLHGPLQLGEQIWSGAWIGLRDHSWGERPMGMVDGTTGFFIPGQLYAMLVYTQGQMVSFGRAVTASGEWIPVREPHFTPTERGGQLFVPGAGVGPWSVQRLVKPLITWYGRAGYEAVRDDPQPDDLLRGEFGPAVFTSPDGKTVVGFLDQLKKVSNYSAMSAS
jgi:hypothetical protein